MRQRGEKEKSKIRKNQPMPHSKLENRIFQKMAGLCRGSSTPPSAGGHVRQQSLRPLFLDSPFGHFGLGRFADSDR